MINHYGLNPADPETRRMLRQEMEEFFFGENAQLPEGWTPPSAAPTKGGGVPARK
jgi:Fe-S cluster biosynthesis and repair protein YggX